MIDRFTVVDAHAHYAYPVTSDSLDRVLLRSGADEVCLAALPGCRFLDATPDLLCYKLLHPHQTFVFGCLDCTAYQKQFGDLGKRHVKRAKQLLLAGCDGIKLLEGKPTMRRDFSIPDFDAPQWEAFWAYAEQTRLPILWHVNDPETYWSAAALPQHARDSGWGYGADDVNNEEQYRQVRAVFERHPALNVTLAHLFFLSADLPRLSNWLDAFPNLRVDLTPGVELYENLSHTPEEARAFLTKYQDRVQYGTDIGGRAVINGKLTALNERECLRRTEIINAFLCGKASVGVRADGDYLIGTEPFVLHGLNLPPDVLQKIYHDNFYAFIGCDAPKPVDPVRTLRLVRQLKRTLRSYARQKGVPPDLSAAESNERFLEHLLDQ